MPERLEQPCRIRPMSWRVAVAPVQASRGQVGQHHIRVSLLDQGQQLLAVSGSPTMVTRSGPRHGTGRAYTLARQLTALVVPCPLDGRGEADATSQARDGRTRGNSAA